MILKGKVEVLIRVPKGVKPDGTPDYELKKVAELGAGAPFGELAIMEDTLKPRAATIVAKEDCHFATLERKPYRAILGKYHRLETFAKVSFLSQLHIFKGWTFHEMKTWMYLFERKEKYLRKSVVYKEGDPADFIYLVKSGEVVCSKVIEVNYHPQNSENVVLDNENRVLVFDKEPLRKSVELNVLGPGQLFGEEEAWEAYKIEKEIERERQEEGKKKKGRSSDSETDSDSDSDNEKAKKQFVSVKKMPTRIFTVTVTSLEAEIWSIPRKVLDSYFMLIL
jgi:cAMP-binding proteins - catabolite gene activator and regulatory subunit of cAMP-dependent protein kinases